MSEPDLDDFHDERVALRVARHRIHALEKELESVRVDRDQIHKYCQAHQNALKEAKAALECVAELAPEFLDNEDGHFSALTARALSTINSLFPTHATTKTKRYRNDRRADDCREWGEIIKL